MKGQIAIQPYTSHWNYHLAIHTQKYKCFLFLNVWPNCYSVIFNKKGVKISELLMAIQLYTSHSAIHTQTQTQMESEAFKTHLMQSSGLYFQIKHFCLQGPFDYGQAKQYGVDVWECNDNCYTRIERHGSKYTESNLHCM